MSSSRKSEAYLRDYLLGELPPKSRQELEEQMMTDNRVYEELLILEEELIDDYVRDELDGHENERFESHFLSTPERRQKLSFAAALRDYVESAPAPEVAREAEKRQEPVRPPIGEWFSNLVGAPSRALGASMAAALILVVLSGGWNWRLQAQLARMTADRASLEKLEQDLQNQLAGERSRGGALADELLSERSRRVSLEEEATSLRAAQRSISSFRLSPFNMRGPGKMPRVIIASETSLVRLQLDMGVDDYESYWAALHTVDGDEIWIQKRLEVDTSNDSAVVNLILPVPLLRRGDYYFRLIGVASDGDDEHIDRYTFRVLEE